MAKGKLSLVGAGPGDPELITLKAIRIIASANVILYDALVNEALLKYALPGSVIQFVGKRYGCPSLSQQEINCLIIESAASYGHVVRLKGGDPFVYGRAMEEIAAARAAGIEVEVIPGLTSAIAVPASLMIPMTCRGVSESFWVTTGTTRSGEVSDDIQFAAQSHATVIILMAMSKIERIMDIFIQNNKSDTPVAIIEQGTTEKERMVIGTVKDICFKSESARLTPPSIIVVGDVVKFSSLHLKEIVQNNLPITTVL